MGDDYDNIALLRDMYVAVNKVNTLAFQQAVKLIESMRMGPRHRREAVTAHTLNGK
jgi:hypothetical protein